VAYTDRELGRLLDALRSDGALERTLVAVTSDHGEEFGEHGEWGHVQLHRETLRVPLILRLPGDAPGGGRVVEGRAGLVDLHATLLAAAGLAPQPHSTGRDLGPALASGRVTERPRFASTNEHLSLEPGRYPWRRSVRRGDRALLVRTFPGPEERTLLAVEPGTWEEGDPLDAVEPRAAELARMIETHVARQRAIRAELLSGAADDGRRPLDARARDELGALGYVDEGD
jgi:arylsulfatase A-like enzyme